MFDPVLIYGAAGFTGQLIVREALARGLRPVLAGRNGKKLAALAASEGLSHRAFALNDSRAIAENLNGVEVVLNAAGPFHETAVKLARACLDCGAHYLDIAGEVAVFEELVKLNDEARERRVMLMPGVGFDVVATDCLSGLVAAKVPKAQRLELALSGLNAISRGSADSVFDQYDELVTVRRNGRLMRSVPGELAAEFDFGRGSRRAVAITWGDVSTAYYTTGIPDITVYYEAIPIVELGLNLNRYAKWMFSTPAWNWWRKVGVNLLPEGPNEEQRARGRAVVVARAADAVNRRAELRLETPEVYSFTASTSVAVVDRVLSQEYKPGFQTPAQVYGSDYVLSLPGVTLTDVQ